MEIEHTAIPGVEIIHPRVFGDSRGYFFEAWNSRDFAQAVRPVDFCQDNESEYLEFCSRNNYIYENPMLYFCRSRENEYIDFLEHFGLM